MQQAAARAGVPSRRLRNTLRALCRNTLDDGSRNLLQGGVTTSAIQESAKSVLFPESSKDFWKMSECNQLDRPHSSKKRHSSTEDAEENVIDDKCCCYENSACVVQLLRAKRLKNSSNVRRKLDFGPTETSEQENAFVSQLEDNSNSVKVWNFDFKEEKPLPGTWIWMAASEGARSSPHPTSEELTSTEPKKQKTLKDIFKVKKKRTSGKPSNPFLRPLAPIRTPESTSA